MNTRELTFRQCLDALRNLDTESTQGFVEDARQLADQIQKLCGWTSFRERMPTHEDAIDGYLVEVWSVSDVSQALTVPVELLDAATIAQYQLTHWRRVQEPEKS
jgi:hypothetical protein